MQTDSKTFPRKPIAGETAQFVKVQDIKASDHVLFVDTVYKVRSVNTDGDRVYIAYHNVNDEQAYTYERDTEVEKVQVSAA